MKKTLKWIAAILLTPVLLFLILTALLYVPPVQNWAVRQVAAIASEKTGMQISVEHVDLKFPLDLAVDGVLAIRDGDTIAHVRRAVADVKLRPLLKKQVVVSQLQLNDAKVNSLDLISDVQVKGRLGHFSVSSDGIDLNQGTAMLNDARLADADVTVLLSDTAAVDTTTSETLWKINFDHINIERTRVDLHMPGDSMRVEAYMGHASASDGSINLTDAHYSVGKLDWRDGTLSYDRPYEPPQPVGIDYNHLQLSGIGIGLDSIDYRPEGLGLRIRDAAMKERSGLEITDLRGPLRLDDKAVHVEHMTLRTPHSAIQATADVDFSVADSVRPGRLHAYVDAQIGKADLQLLASDVPQPLLRRMTSAPLCVKATVDGNLQQADVRNLDIDLPRVLHATASGRISNLTDPANMLAQLNVRAQAYDARLISDFIDLPKGYRLPDGMTLEGGVDMQGSRYRADVVARHGKGSVAAKGYFDQKAMSYSADVKVSDLNLHAFMPHDSLYHLTADVSLRGQGTDFMSRSSHLDAKADIHHLQYGHLSLGNMQATARLSNGHALAHVTGSNSLFDGSVDVDALLSSLGSKKQKQNSIEATMGADLSRLDLHRLGLSSNPLTIGMCGHIDVSSDLDERYSVTGLIGDLYIRDSVKTYRPKDVGLVIKTSRDTTLARIQSGNLIVKMDAQGGYKRLFSQLTALGDTMRAQYEQRTIDQPRLKQMLPSMRLYATSGRDNPLANMLRASSGIDFKDLYADFTTSPSQGINGTAYVHSLNIDSTRIDTVSVRLRDSEKGLTFNGQVTNNRRNPQFVFNAIFDGLVQEHGASLGVRLYDDKGDMGLRLGAKADMEADGLRFTLLPSRPTIGYKEFDLNKDNYLLLRRDSKLQAKVDLMADDGTGVKIYSENQDSTLLQDLTISLNRFDLDQLTQAVPFLPHISGTLGGDYHLMMNADKQISVASDMQIANLSYENCPMGNIATEFVYLQREDDTHAVEGIIMREGREVGAIRGSYQNKGDGLLDASLTLNRTPMEIVNGFIPDQLFGFEGYAEGEVSVKGSLRRPEAEGEIYLDSAYLVSHPYGVRLRFDNDPVRIVDSKLLLENFTMYAHNQNPLNIMGNIDFHDTDHMTMDMRMRAQNFQLINSKRTAKSVAYGKMFVNFFARMNGPMDRLRLRGKLDVLGTTDLNYILLDSPLSTDNQLDELVKFTDFNDSTQTSVQKPTPEGLDMDLAIDIDEGTHVDCYLNADQTNYVDLFGGGNLRMRYNGDGIRLNGRYTMNSGEMKYSLPVIPLKTFTIQDGSYVEFTGDPMNPRLNLTATERTKATVGREGEQSRNVAFDCGVVITKTLNDMGLEFIIDAPEDMAISSELGAMSTEQRGKLAVTMLTTGMYLADGNTSGFSMNSALSSFLESEINNITAGALKTLDLSIGLDNTTDASGQMHTDYSFRFAKRFWNNRLKVQVGGKVSTGSEMQGQQQSFFDNVTMEYRLSPTANQYVKLFYNQNVYDWLDGYTGEYGGGFVWKRKLDSFWDIFKFKTKSNLPVPSPRGGSVNTHHTGVKTDSLFINRKEEGEKENREETGNEKKKTEQ